ncbi:hypothetical protein [Polycladidibacter hongkongensis]|uniref:hypothetical protein n=1 Tax=Polycladidibacter hongkongensis TaxID=1647556 RepID=UPI000830B177|nr:hypothetical protein [Pseudovibrio hongkongensis]
MADDKQSEEGGAVSPSGAAAKSSSLPEQRPAGAAAERAQGEPVPSVSQEVRSLMAEIERQKQEIAQTTQSFAQSAQGVLAGVDAAAQQVMQSMSQDVARYQKNESEAVAEMNAGMNPESTNTAASDTTPNVASASTATETGVAQGGQSTSAGNQNAAQAQLAALPLGQKEMVEQLVAAVKKFVDQRINEIVEEKLDERISPVIKSLQTMINEKLANKNKV